MEVLRLSALSARRRAGAVADGASPGAIAPDRLDRNVRCNKESLDLPSHRRNGNRVRRDVPLAICRFYRSNRAGWSYPQFQGWALQEPDDGVEQVGSAFAVLLVPVAETNPRSEEHTSELQSLMPHSYPVFCLK